MTSALAEAPIDLHNLTSALAALSPPSGWRAADAFVDTLSVTGEWVLRLGLAALFGAILGGEREINGHEAGLRTFILVCVGSALAMVVSLSMVEVDWSRSAAAGGAHAGLVEDDGVETATSQPAAAAVPGASGVAVSRAVVSVDPGRIAYGVMAGIGFLGAGVIFRDDGRVRGLTTAASIWAAAAVGLACGLGLYILSFVAMAILLVTLTLLNLLGNWLPAWKKRRLQLRVDWQPDCVEALEAMLRDKGRLRVRRVRLVARDENVTPPKAVLSAEVQYLRESRWIECQRMLIGDPHTRVERIL